jgi:glycogen operon protein
VAWPPDAGSRSGLAAQDESGTDSLLDWARTLIRLRASHPVFRRRRFFQGEPLAGRPDQVGDIAWFTPSGEEMTGEDWDAGFAKSLTVFLNGDGISEPDPRGQRVRDDSFLLLFNASEADLKFAVPAARYGEQWQRVLDTAAEPAADRPAGDGAAGPLRAGDTIEVGNRSLQVLRRA